MRPFRAYEADGQLCPAQKLEAEGSVTTESSGARHKTVTLTPRGAELAEKTVAKVIEIENEILGSWPAEDLEKGHSAHGGIPRFRARKGRGGAFMNIKLSDHFDYKRLLRFALPSIIMMIFTSIYGIVDGFFVSNYAGKTAFAAVNLIMPLLLVLGCVGFMFGTGGGALIAKTMGERKADKANEIFTLIITVSVLCGVVLAVLGFFLLRPVAKFMGAEGELLEQSIIYGRIILIALPFYILQFEFQCLFATAEKPKLGLYVTVASGVANMILDALLVGVISLGVTGAAAATAISEFDRRSHSTAIFCTQK